MSKKILVAEDDSVMLHLIKFKLQSKGYKVLAAENGVAVKEILEKQTPDLILLDLMLPFLNGFELLGLIRNQLKLDIPVVVISSTPLQTIITKSLDMGANDFISKPFNPNDLLTRLEKLLTVGANPSLKNEVKSKWDVNFAG